MTTYNGFKNYYQWETASPYDDEPDWSEFNITCPECQGDMLSDTDTSDYPIVEFECDDCSHEWKQNVEKHFINRKQRKRLDELEEELSDLRHNRKYKDGLSIEDFFECATQNIEDFEWENEPGEWHTSGNQVICFSLTMGRENNKRYVELYEIDSDGNADLYDCYDEREGLYPGDWDELSKTIANLTDDFFIDWAGYWIECAETGKDPLNQTIGQVNDWVEFCIKNAESDIEYFKMGQ